MFKIIPAGLVISCLSMILCCTNASEKSIDALTILHQGRNAQIETGNMYVGIEMHNSLPLLNRISFYYPRANSIDLSRDYWKREQWRIQKLAIQVDEGPVRWLGDHSWDIEQTPFNVIFKSKLNELDVEIHYQFCDSLPAFAASFLIGNRSDTGQEITFFTELALTLKTCHAYTAKKPEQIRSSEDMATLIAEFESEETGRARIFIQNTAEMPIRHKTCWTDSAGRPGLENLIASENPGAQLYDAMADQDPGGAFLYKKHLNPGDRMRVVQIIGSTLKENLDGLLKDLQENYTAYIRGFEENLHQTSTHDLPLALHDDYLDHSVGWARSVMETNRHWLDGDVLYMPCPAQYNFFFTHDMLYADLTTVHFMPERVKHDLNYLVTHADADLRIPHARYWREDGYKTEFADTDNWNNMWMVITTASWLRHTGDQEFVERVYPFLEKCLGRGLVNLKPDSLIWSASPDWWDIGNNFGPRAYRTILAVKMIEDYLYISSVLGKNLEALPAYEHLAGNLRRALNTRLWDSGKQYYMNFLEGNEADPHYYPGSLVAAHFDLLPDRRRTALIETAESKLFDANAGVRDVFPMDIQDWKDKLRYSGNEAGTPGYYFNGGVWAHNNSWYVLALIREGRYEDACNVVRNLMSVKGIMDGPNGQPAMYEVRNALQENRKVYGSVDKPQFLWAASWYLYDLYRLIGIRESTWNLSIDYRAPLISNRYEALFYAGGVQVRLDRSDKTAAVPFVQDGSTRLPSSVLPATLQDTHPFIDYAAEFNSPVLLGCESILKKVIWNAEKGELQIDVKAFAGHRDSLMVHSRQIPKTFFVDESQSSNWREINSTETGPIYRFNFRHSETAPRIRIVFAE